MSAASRLCLAAEAAGALVVAVACGPGLEMKHESNLRFEHCYRLDTDPRIAGPHREHCWRDWTERYAYDQPLDRVEYARRRIADLEAGDSRTIGIRGTPHPQGRVFAEVGGVDGGPMAAPAPTSPHAPPPKTEPAPGAAAPAPSARPGESCADECARALDGCDHLCAAKQADCAVCREDYRRCMRRCYE